MTNIFLSTPMSVVAKNVYSDFRKEIMAVKKFLSELFPQATITYPGDFIDSHEKFDGPFAAFKNDIAALNRCTTFLLIYPEKTPTSALIELGYAIKMGIPIIIVTATRSILPYMVQMLDFSIENALVVEFEDQDILRCIQRNKEKLQLMVV